MAIALRGTLNHFVAKTNNGNSVVLTFDTITPPLVDDIVVVFGGHGDGNNSAPATPSGYTIITTHGGATPPCGMWYKRMTSTPDTTVSCDGGGNAADSVAFGCYVLSGVDTTNAIDVTPNSATGTSTDPNCPAITTANPDAWVFAVACGDNIDKSITAPTGYSDFLAQDGTNDTNDVSIAAARFQNPGADAEDPPPFTTWSSSTWFAITAAFRPAPAGGDVLQPQIWM